MSDLSEAATALGVPEAIVKRSAEARAKATGATVDEVLAAWAGGAPAPTAQEPTTEAATPETPPPDATEETPDATEQLPPAAAPAISEPHVSRLTSHVSQDPPILVGRVERTGAMVAGVIGLLLLSLLLAIAAPAMPAASDQIRSSNLPFSAAALAGREVYAAQACGSCHTQMVRNVVSDVGLGPVTLADTNQVPGYRRYGPDLAAVGRRVTDPATLASIVSGEGGHPIASGLSEQEINDLVAYLLESR